MGKFKSLWDCLGRRKLEALYGRRNRAGQGGKEMRLPIGIWEPLLRFIGVGILRTWGIIHGKASLSGSVYKMRQGWQRWRPSTTGPSCLNMGAQSPDIPTALAATIHRRPDKHTDWQRIVIVASYFTLSVSQAVLWDFTGICIFPIPPSQTKCTTFSFQFVTLNPQLFFFLLLWGLHKHVLTYTLFT